MAIDKSAQNVLFGFEHILYLVFIDSQANIVYDLEKSTYCARLEGNYMSTGQKLKALRGDKTQKEVAEDLKITKSALAMYEKDKRVPRDEIKIRLAEYYGETVQSLFFSN